MTRSLGQSGFAAVIFGLLASLAFYGWLDAVQRKKAAEAEAAARQVQLDSLTTERGALLDSLARANAARTRADAAAAIADRELAAARAVAEAQVVRARRAQDSLAAAIVAVVPDSVVVMVQALEAEHENERRQAAVLIRSLEAALQVRGEQLAAADAQLQEERRLQANLEAALALQVQQTETWQRAARSPGFFEGFGRSLTQVVTAAALGFALGAAAGG